MTPCVMYVRVSSEEQAKAGYSIPFQRGRLEQHALEHKLTIVERFEDVHTAKESGRPGFAAMLAFLDDNPRVRSVLVHRLDRLSRNLYQYAQLVEQLGVEVCSVMEPAENNAAGRMTHGMSAVVAKYHSDNLRAEVKKGMRAKFEAGGCIAKAPIGYKNVPRTRTQKATVVLDDRLAPVVRALFERYARGRTSVLRLAREGFDLGVRTGKGRPRRDANMRSILRNPFYVGLTRYRGELRPGAHPPIISRELFDRVQTVMRRRSSVRGDKGSKFFLLRGLAWCASCDRRMTAEDHPAKSCAYYRCLPSLEGVNCPERYAPVTKLDEQVHKLLPRIELDAARKADALARVAAEARLREEARTKKEPKLLVRKAKLEDKNLKVADLLAGGTLTAAEYHRLRAGYDDELRQIDDRLDFLRVDFSRILTDKEAAIEAASSLTSFFALAPNPDERKDFLGRVFKRLVVKDAHIVGLEYTPLFSLLLENPFKRVQDVE